MRYMLLIYNEERQMSPPRPSERPTMLAAYAAFGEAAQRAGVLQSGDALQPTLSATSVRVRDGQRLTTDGPFAETKEQLGGFYILDCQNAEEALAWAARVPGAANGAVEVRPIMQF